MTSIVEWGWPNSWKTEAFECQKTWDRKGCVNTVLSTPRNWQAGTASPWHAVKSFSSAHSQPVYAAKLGGGGYLFRGSRSHTSARPLKALNVFSQSSAQLMAPWVRQIPWQSPPSHPEPFQMLDLMLPAIQYLAQETKLINSSGY